MGGSTCDVTLITPDEGIARVRYGLIWKKHNHVDGSSIKKLGLTVEPLQWPGPESLLHVSISWGKNIDSRLMNSWTQPHAVSEIKC